MNIYPIILFDNTYIYILSIKRIRKFVKQTLCFLVICNTDTHIQKLVRSHWFHIHIIFPSCFYLIIVTSRISLPNCEHVPSYQYRKQSNLVKAFLVLYSEFLTDFKHNFIAPNGKISALDTEVKY